MHFFSAIKVDFFRNDIWHCIYSSCNPIVLAVRNLISEFWLRFDISAIGRLLNKSSEIFLGISYVHD